MRKRHERLGGLFRAGGGHAAGLQRAGNRGARHAQDFVVEAGALQAQHHIAPPQDPPLFIAIITGPVRSEGTPCALSAGQGAEILQPFQWRQTHPSRPDLLKEPGLQFPVALQGAMPVQMVGQDVEQNPHVRTEIHGGFELEGTDLQHQPVLLGVFEHQPGHGEPVIPGRLRAQAGRLQGFRQPFNRRAFPIRTRQRQHAGGGAAAAPAKLQLRDNPRASAAGLNHPRRCFRNARTDDAEIRRLFRQGGRPQHNARPAPAEDLRPQAQGLRIAAVQKNRLDLFVQQEFDGGLAAVAQAKNQRCLLKAHRSFRVATPSKALMMERIQKRVTIRVSTTSTSRPSRSARSFSTSSK